MKRRALIDFALTSAILGAAFVLAFVSSAISRSGHWGVGAAAAVAALVLALGGGLYIVPKLARRVRWEALGFGIRTSLTTAGYLFFLLVVVVGVAAWNTENNLLYLILASLLAFILVTGNIGRMMLHDLGVQLRVPDHIVAGESVEIAVTVVNRKTLVPSCSISVEGAPRREADMPAVPPPAAPPRGRKHRKREGARLAHVIVVPPRSSVRQVVEHVFPKRGRYRIDAFTLSTSFPSGFLTKWREVSSEGDIVVFPRTRPIDDFFHTLPILAGSSESHIRGDGIELFGLRDYRPSDHIRRIDWKASARSRRLTVRETVREEDFRLSIFFDTRRPDADPAERFADRFESAVEMAASLASHFIKEGSDVELVTPSSRISPGAGPGHLYKILGVLAVVTPDLPGDEAPNRVSWDLLDTLPALGDDHRFKVLFTSAPKGTIPASVWRSAHVVYLEDL
jgi:uncharacterized protein (DUF58 family)